VKSWIALQAANVEADAFEHVEDLPGELKAGKIDYFPG